uniref:Uncharacterized protein n=1 Tax=Chlamydomonas leiostraca TaxID=1034604 RepID=A0A7S0X2J5_9CHLO|eukprot:CAMPEP_0202873424 /NCGR_PEP_ID=MMETSP1391-20130828/23247_1 /ASSEMBLY_ACC=CAM_ASM_000867 /TAXON_ID=1034604 /ORGANISM="Chlamydomonas leiostraca, Strain SAG 11-49" /LENGTH=208 /DNA_ID=CAMNT_0049554643 /DNA_START=27 /DNA_END=653 /DNA_ORIENTATION=-
MSHLTGLGNLLSSRDILMPLACAGVGVGLLSVGVAVVRRNWSSYSMDSTPSGASTPSDVSSGAEALASLVTHPDQQPTAASEAARLAVHQQEVQQGQGDGELRLRTALRNFPGYGFFDFEPGYYEHSGGATPGPSTGQNAVLGTTYAQLLRGTGCNAAVFSTVGTWCLFDDSLQRDVPGWNPYKSYMQRHIKVGYWVWHEYRPSSMHG